LCTAHDLIEQAHGIPHAACTTDKAV